VPFYEIIFLIRFFLHRKWLEDCCTIILKSMKQRTSFHIENIKFSYGSDLSLSFQFAPYTRLRPKPVIPGLKCVACIYQPCWQISCMLKPWGPCLPPTYYQIAHCKIVEVHLYLFYDKPAYLGSSHINFYGHHCYRSGLFQLGGGAPMGKPKNFFIQ